MDLSFNGLCGRKAAVNSNSSEFRSCVKVEVDVPDVQSELRNRVKVEVAVMGSPSLIVLTVSVDL